MEQVQVDARHRGHQDHGQQQISYCVQDPNGIDSLIVFHRVSTEIDKSYFLILASLTDHVSTRNQGVIET